LKRIFDLCDKLQKNQQLTHNDLQTLKRNANLLDIWDFAADLRIEKNRRRLEDGKDQRLIICDDCLQEKWVYAGETKCHSCQAGMLYSDLRKKQKDAEILEEEG
ncbi:MAG: hypothetical protein DRP02_08845, partial [Candidatus Gerdarchaeota archaeon]